MEGVEEQWDQNLPRRLFATDRYPNSRLNVYSKPDMLALIHHCLKGSAEWEVIRNSCFGRLFDIPLARCPISGKLIHALLARQLLSNKKYELWMVFGGQPLRFSLTEFGSVTGLPCGDFAEGYYPDFPVFDSKWVPDDAWREVVSDVSTTTCADLAAKLEAESDMPSKRRIQIALICLVDAVLIANTATHRPTPRYVRLVRDIDAFLNFPWGRESFVHTIGTMYPEVSSRAHYLEAVDSFRIQLSSGTMRVCGFALALQLLAFKQIPCLLARLKDTAEEPILLEHPGETISRHGSLTLEAVHLAEADPRLSVCPMVEIGTIEADCCFGWDDESKDRRVKYMVGLLKSRGTFREAEWPGGAVTFPFIEVRLVKSKVDHRKHIFDRKKKPNQELKVVVNRSGSTKSSAQRLRRRVSDVNVAAPGDITAQNEWLLGQVKYLTEQVKVINENQKKLLGSLSTKKNPRARKLASLIVSCRRNSKKNGCW